MAKIRIVDDLHPEDCAMVQALYSRSPAPVEDHLAKVDDSGSGKFMEKFYIGYGHASIGDCGSTTIFIEGVSMLAAKAIQQWPLYSGQESSTRYMDFSEVHFENPQDGALGEEIQEAWRDFYLKGIEVVNQHVRDQYPPDRMKESFPAYERSVAARTFDIMRAWLPAGATTNLSWHTNLRQASDHLTGLIGTGDVSVSALVYDMLHALSTKYPNSFKTPSASKRAWARECEQLEHLVSDTQLGALYEPLVEGTCNITAELSGMIKRPDIRALLNDRPKGMPVPRFLEQVGQIRSEFILDYGSWRDIQRHRHGFVSKPILKMTRIHQWYLNQLPEALRQEGLELFEAQAARIEKLQLNEIATQYYVPMGSIMLVSVTQTLPAWIYRVELRSSKMVHPTLRIATLAEIAEFKRECPFERYIELHYDDDIDDWDLRRGTQTITEKS